MRKYLNEVRERYNAVASFLSPKERVSTTMPAAS